MAVRRHGSSINVTTMVAEFGAAGMGLYGLSKAALVLLTKSWAADYGPRGVRVNAVSPGPTRTEGTAAMGEALDGLAAAGPAGRPGSPEEIAKPSSPWAASASASCSWRSPTRCTAAPAPTSGACRPRRLLHHSCKRRPTDSAQQWHERSVTDVQALAALFRRGNYDALNSADTVTVVTGKATFTDPHTVGVGVDRITITADTILINTGSAIIGGGYLGIEFASIYHQFGARVTVLESAPRILGREDDDVAEAAEAVLTDAGIEFVMHAHVVEVRDGDHGTAVVYEQSSRQHTLEVDAVLAATGRVPATRDLGLDAAGVRTTERGEVEVDEYLRTSQPHIYALGDVNGGPQFTYISLDDSRIVLDQLTGDGRRSAADRVAVPRPCSSPRM
jgi:hypothetical protein